MVYQEYDYNERAQLQDGFIEQGYGSASDPAQYVKAPRSGKPRAKKGLNLVPACLGLVLPWVLFVCLSAAMSFSLHFFSPGWCWFLIALATIAVLGCLVFACVSWARGRDATWHIVLFVLMLIALVASSLLGTINFRKNLRPWYDSKNLNNYEDVDPATFSGQQMMDAGQITFVKGTHPDLSKAIGFRSQQMYCVAPIMPKNMSADQKYDFWAVGINCCTGQPNEYHCDEYDNHEAHSGLRLIDQTEQSFFRLAVQQAEAAYGLKAPHPVFLRWMQEPEAELTVYADDGMSFFLISIFCHLGFQVLAIASSIFFLAKVA